MTTLMVVIVAVLLVAGGYVANIVKMLYMIGDPLTTLFFARIVGIFLGPLGVVLGFF